MKYASFAWRITKYCDFFYLCLFTYTHKHTGGELLRTVKTFHWYIHTHRWCAPLVNFHLNAELVYGGNVKLFFMNEYDMTDSFIFQCINAGGSIFNQTLYIPEFFAYTNMTFPQPCYM